MKNIIIIAIFILKSIVSNAHIETNAESLFKMWIFIDLEKSLSLEKNDSNLNFTQKYKRFSDIVLLNKDSLMVTNNIKKGHDFVPDYNFYIVDLFKVTYASELTEEEKTDFMSVIGASSKYIIAINQKTGRTYRISGFIVSDFLGFLSDFKNEYENKMNGAKLSTRLFLDNYKVSNIDFECLYKGLKCDNPDRYSEYPCLRRCVDPFGIEHR